MRIHGKRLASILAGAALLTATAAAGYAAHSSPASCWIAGPEHVVHSHTIDGWRVQACVFDRVLNGRVTDQTGISAIAIPPPAPQPEPLPRTQPTRIFHYRPQGR